MSLNPVQLECYLLSDVFFGLDLVRDSFGEFSRLHFGNANRTLYLIEDLVGDLGTIFNNDCDDDEDLEYELNVAMGRLAALPPTAYVDLEN